MDWPNGLCASVLFAQCQRCQFCYEKLKQLDGTGQVPQAYAYCAVNHVFVKAPIDGQLTMKDIMVMIQDRKPVRFSEWLEELRKPKWPQEWQQIFLEY